MTAVVSVAPVAPAIPVICDRCGSAGFKSQKGLNAHQGARGTCPGQPQPGDLRALQRTIAACQAKVLREAAADLEWRYRKMTFYRGNGCQSKIELHTVGIELRGMARTLLREAVKE